jgi:hypothetical protein
VDARAEGGVELLVDRERRHRRRLELLLLLLGGDLLFLDGGAQVGDAHLIALLREDRVDRVLVVEVGRHTQPVELALHKRRPLDRVAYRHRHARVLQRQLNRLGARHGVAAARAATERVLGDGAQHLARDFLDEHRGQLAVLEALGRVLRAAAVHPAPAIV